MLKSQKDCRLSKRAYSRSLDLYLFLFKSYPKVMNKYFYARVAVDTNLYTVPFKEEFFRYGAEIIIDTEFGEDLAYVTSFPFGSKSEKAQVAQVKRFATKEDKALFRSKELEACQLKKDIRRLIEKLGLGMNLTHVLLPIKGQKMCVYYTAKGRVDFRELLKELAKLCPKTKTILRQIGPSERRDSFAIDARIPYGKRKYAS